MLEQRIDADLRLGRHAVLVGELTGLVAEHPLRERLAGLLMVALQRCGRQADALAVYAQTRRRLVEDLGIEPGAELQCWAPAGQVRPGAGVALPDRAGLRPGPQQLLHPQDAHIQRWLLAHPRPFV